MTKPFIIISVFIIIPNFKTKKTRQVSKLKLAFASRGVKKRNIGMPVVDYDTFSFKQPICLG